MAVRQLVGPQARRFLRMNPVHGEGLNWLF